MDDVLLPVIYAIIRLRIRLFQKLVPHWNYLKYVLRHKKFVWIYGRKLNVPIWNLITHDLSKFSAEEWFPYVNFFYGPKVPHCVVCKKQLQVNNEDFLVCTNMYCSNAMIISSQEPIMKPSEEVQHAFDVACHKHQIKNPHHWQHYLFHSTRPEQKWELWHEELKPVVYSLEQRRTILEPTTPKYAKHDVEAAVKALNGAPLLLPIPDVYAREMAADWLGANAAQGKIDGAIWDWWQSTKIHPQSQHTILNYIERVVNTTKH